jgi:hypothetical protein
LGWPASVLLSECHIATMRTDGKWRMLPSVRASRAIPTDESG